MAPLGPRRRAPAYAAARGYGVGHAFVHGAPLAALAAMGTFGDSRRFHSALTSDRVYRRAFDVDTAIEMMRAERGRHFDPVALGAFLAALDEVMAIRSRFVTSLTHA